MANSTFPGVYVTIVDNSFYTESIPGAIGFMCMLSQKGEDNRPVLTTSASDLIARYGEGNPAKYGQGWYVAKQYVDILDNLWVVRVLPDDAKYSTLSLKLGESEVNKVVLSSQPSKLSEMDTLINDGEADLMIYPIGRGEWYNNLAIKITPATGSYDNAYIMDVYELGTASSIPALVESYTISFDISAKDMSGESIFIEDVLEMYSSRLRCKVSDKIGPLENAVTWNTLKAEGLTYVSATSFTTTSNVFKTGQNLKLTQGTSKIECKVDSSTLEGDKYTVVISGGAISNEEITLVEVKGFDYSEVFTSYIYLEGGTDGTMYDANGNLDWEKIQDDMAKAYSGLSVNPLTNDTNEIITDAEEMDYSIVFDAAYPTTVKDAIVDLCEARGSCFALLDNGDNATPAAALAKRQSGGHNYTSYRCALYEPFTKVYDSFTGKYIWITPVYHAVNAFCKTARDKNIWWAFAGLQRGGCTGIKEFRYKLAGGYKQQFKDNELNPIMRFTQGGDVIWGNWSAQQTPSALKNIHVVLCLQYIWRTLSKSLKTYIYEFNDTYTWSIIKNTVTAFLSELQTERALEYFSVNVYATDYDKRNNRCKVDISLRVTGTIETINVTLGVE